MAIRPIDVRRKEFKSGFRGYDANQVDDFLDQVADEFERAYTDNQRMREENSSLRDRLAQFEDLEGSIRSALVHAEQAANDLRNSAQREADDLRNSARREAENLRANSQREAELTIQEAQNRAHQTLSDSSSRVERIQDSYEALQTAKREFTNDFRNLLKTYMDVMENMEISSAKGIEASLRQRLDTESMAVAREAADQPTLSEGSASEGSASADEGREGGPLHDGETGVAASSTEETQRIDPSELPEYPQSDAGSAEADLAAEEPEPSTVSGNSEPDTSEIRTSEASSSGAAGEVDQEEPPLEENEAADRFFEDRAQNGDSRRDEGKIFRASRFLRRRGG